MGGYIKIDRKMLRWGWYQNANTARVFLHLLLICEWEDTALKGHVIPAGHVFLNEVKVSSDLRLSRKEVRTAIEHLQATGEIQKIPGTKWAGAGQLVKIENWALYQSKKSRKGQRKANEGPTKGQPTIIKEIKEIDSTPKGKFITTEDGYEVFVPEEKGTMN